MIPFNRVLAFPRSNPNGLYVSKKRKSVNYLRHKRIIIRGVSTLGLVGVLVVTRICPVAGETSNRSVAEPNTSLPLVSGLICPVATLILNSSCLDC